MECNVWMAGSQYCAVIDILANWGAGAEMLGRAHHGAIMVRLSGWRCSREQLNRL
jgi:hypothetical protein